MKGEIMSFPDKRRLKEHTSTKPTLQDMLRGQLKEDEGKERERGEHRDKRSKINKYLSRTTLNVNRLNTPIKRHRVAE